MEDIIKIICPSMNKGPVPPLAFQYDGKDPETEKHIDRNYPRARLELAKYLKMIRREEPNFRDLSRLKREEIYNNCLKKIQTTLRNKNLEGNIFEEIIKKATLRIHQICMNKEDCPRY